MAPSGRTIETRINSFHESDRTDSGFAGDNASTWRFSHSYQPTHDSQKADVKVRVGWVESIRSPTSPDYSTKQFLENFKLEKTGWLYIKHWLTRTNSDKIELASKRQWKHYWIHLKGRNLLLFNNYSDCQPKLTIDITDSLCYPLPEHPHRNYVFNLTTLTGDTYCIQSNDQTDLDRWIQAVHLKSLLIRNEDNLKYEIEQLKQKARREQQIVKLARLQLKLINNEKTRSLIIKQIQSWEINLESLFMDIFRYKCYLAAYSTHRHLPNPQDLLSCVMASTKSALNKLMAFTPCGVYSCVAARRQYEHQTVNINVQGDSTINLKTTVSIRKSTTVRALLITLCTQFNLSIDEYYLYFSSPDGLWFVANLNERLDQLRYSSVMIGKKLIYQIDFTQPFHLSGIHLSSDQQSKLFVKHVDDQQKCEQFDIRKGDEVIMINQCRVEDLDLNRLNDFLNEIPLSLTMRSSRFNIDSLKQQKSNSKTLSDGKRLEKVIEELVDTEKSYIQDLEHLLNQFIRPMRDQSDILSKNLVDSLHQTVESLHRFHLIFIQRLQLSRSAESISSSIANDFIHYANEFKIYSTYCAMHLRLNRLLETPEKNARFRSFLATRNPTQQHSSSFESYLIKPVQRIVKYPLFLQQMLNFSNNASLVQTKVLKKSMRIMIKISKYLNSMQELYEEFGRSFEFLIEKNYEHSRSKLELNLPDLCAYGEVDWLNIDSFVPGKFRRKSMRTFCFVFKNGCVLIARDATDSSADVKLRSNVSDRFLRFIPVQSLNAELMGSDKNEPQYWQLIETDRSTNEKKYFRLRNKDADVYVRTIKSCTGSLERSRSNVQQCRTFVQSDPFFNRPPHALISSQHRSTSHSDRTLQLCHRRSPSPIWKRRTSNMRQRHFSTVNNPRGLN